VRRSRFWDVIEQLEKKRAGRMKATIVVRVKPGSKNPGISRDDDAIVVSVRERAMEGAANAAVVRALAKVAGLAPSCVTLVRGERARVKMFSIDGISDEELRGRLDAAVR
jgi:uncharacterized protein